MKFVLRLDGAAVDVLHNKKSAEYIVRINNANHFVKLEFEQIWSEKGLIVGQARHMIDGLSKFNIGKILGESESDIRGWIVLIE